jgi:serine/threonine protein phosphatase 1
MLTLAIGDVHGHVDKLIDIVERCERHCAGQDYRLVFLGDYVDRGPASREVVDRLIDLERARPEHIVCLRGNHEAAVLDLARGGDFDENLWLDIGGGTVTLASYGIAHVRDLPASHLAWMASLPLFYDDGRRFFTHAGVNPARPLADQQEEDLLWIREPFLSHTGDFGRLVVHGHTPLHNGIPDLRGNRLNLDTAAGYGGPVTAAVFLPDRTAPVIYLASGPGAVMTAL